MGKIRDFFKNTFGRSDPQPRKTQPREQLRTIVHEYYGNNVGWFAYNYASNIYQIPEVRTAIQSFAEIFSIIPKYFEWKDKDGNVTYLEGEEDRVINVQANPLQNASQFWVNLITSLMLYSNVFVEPRFSPRTGKLSQLYVLPRDFYDFKLYDDRATVTFGRIGKTYDMSDLIYLNRFSALGGGQKNDLGLYETVIQALAAQAIAVADPNKVRAIMQADSAAQGQLKPGDADGTMRDLDARFDKSVRGIAYVDPQWKITPINWNENDVNRDLMKLVIDIVYNYFGITADIVNNKATEIEYQLFVKNHIEPVARQVEQEFTGKIFSRMEQAHGNRLELDTFWLQVSTLSAKTAFFNVVSRNGVMNNDEMREMIGYAPLPDGLGRKYRVTLDTVNIENADAYQSAKNGAAGAGGQSEKPTGGGSSASEGGNNAAT